MSLGLNGLKKIIPLYIIMPQMTTKAERNSTMRGIFLKTYINKGIEPQGALRRLFRDFGCGDLLKDKPHQFITVALPNTTSLKRILRYIEQPHKWCKGWLSIEKYSKSGENLHLHILKEGYYSKTKIIRDLSRRFKVERNFIDVRRGTEPKDWNNRLSYIKGTKMDTDKMEHVTKDKEWRQKNNLRDFYNIGI